MLLFIIYFIKYFNLFMIKIIFIQSAKFHNNKINDFKKIDIIFF